jgi:hypothetical protein
MDTGLYHDQRLGQFVLSKLRHVFPQAEGLGGAVTVRSVMEFIGMEISQPGRDQTPEAISMMRNYMESQEYYIQRSLLDSGRKSERPPEEVSVSDWEDLAQDHWE